MNNRNLKIQIECGESGSGKTTYATNKWPQNVLLDCANPVNQIKSTGALYFALNQIYGAVSDELPDVFTYLSKALQDGFVLIIDEAEKINETLLASIINTTSLHKDSLIVFIFDLEQKCLYESSTFRKLLEWNLVPSNKAIVNFCAPIEDFAIPIECHIPNASEQLKKELIEMANYNFSNLNKLLWLIVNKQSEYSNVSEEVIREYSFFFVDDKLSDLPKDLFDILKKSSLIGEMFQSCILESPDGFHVSGVKSYLEKLEATHMFICGYLPDISYKFISGNIYTGILKSIEPREKIESQQILLHYYMVRLTSERDKDKRLEYLTQLKCLSYELNNYKNMLFADKRLLHCYLTIGDRVKAKEILADLIAFCKEHVDDTMLYLYLCYFKIRLDISLGCFKDAIGIIKTVQKHFPYESNLYLQYYYAKSLYCIGDVDNAYIEAVAIQKSLTDTSSKTVEDQPVYALTYSLLATIQHHFGIDDYGNHFFTLALNHAQVNLKDKTIYYEILMKCDMYYTLKFSRPLLTESIKYFEAVKKMHTAAETYVNLATEIMFNERDSREDVANLFKKSTETFSKTPNESFAYCLNNQALFYIIYDGDFGEALCLLDKALFVGMSDFTYMTIYLNRCMCNLIIHGCDSSQFQQTYNEFLKYHYAIKSRANATQYDDIYKHILDIIVMERTGYSSKVVGKVEDLLSEKPSSFFARILKDIQNRNIQNPSQNESYQDNTLFYETMNKYKMFFAEFRFWE